MSVYFVRSGDYVKAGYTGNLRRRLRNLPGDASYKPADADFSRLEVLHEVPGSRHDELRAQASLLEFHAIGEWFHATPECLAAVDAAAEHLRSTA